jgi:hypothetical protein
MPNISNYSSKYSKIAGIARLGDAAHSGDVIVTFLKKELFLALFVGEYTV